MGWGNLYGTSSMEAVRLDEHNIIQGRVSLAISEVDGRGRHIHPSRVNATD